MMIPSEENSVTEQRILNTMKKTAVLLAAIMLLGIILTSCAERKLEPGGSGLVDKKNNISYVHAPLNVEAVSYSKNVFAKDGHDFEYRAVYDVNGNKCDEAIMLYDKDSQILIYNISEYSLPSFGEFSPVRTEFFVEGSEEISLAIEDRTDMVNSIADILNGPSLQYTALFADKNYKVKFYSDEHPFICYAFRYFEYTNDQKMTVTVDSLDGYTFIEGVAHTETENDDGTVKITYNFGKYFLYDSTKKLMYPAQFIHDNYENENGNGQ